VNEEEETEEEEEEEGNEEQNPTALQVHQGHFSQTSYASRVTFITGVPVRSPRVENH